MHIRVLVEQRAHGDRKYLASGEVVDIPQDWARELLDRGDAEPVAEKPVRRAEKRPARSKGKRR